MCPKKWSSGIKGRAASYRARWLRPQNSPASLYFEEEKTEDIYKMSAVVNGTKSSREIGRVVGD